MCISEDARLQKIEIYYLYSVQMGITYLVCFKLALSFQGYLNLGSFSHVGPMI